MSSPRSAPSAELLNLSEYTSAVDVLALLALDSRPLWTIHLLTRRRPDIKAIAGAMNTVCIGFEAGPRQDSGYAIEL